jgi:hypothetical protein
MAAMAQKGVSPFLSLFVQVASVSALLDRENQSVRFQSLVSKK